MYKPRRSMPNQEDGKSKDDVVIELKKTFLTSTKRVFGDCENGYGKVVWVKKTDSEDVDSSYEGFFKEGVPDGMGKSFNPKTKRIYFGEFKKGFVTGSGVLVLESGDRYSGVFKNGVPQGVIVVHYKNGDMGLLNLETMEGLKMNKKGIVTNKP